MKARLLVVLSFARVLHAFVQSFPRTQALALARALPTPESERLESLLMIGAKPLEPLALVDAAAALQSHGVARLNGVVEPELAAALRSRILAELSQASDTWAVDDLRMVPGTRLRFSESFEVQFDGNTRSDVLLPLEDELVSAVVAQAVSVLAPALNQAATCLPHYHGASDASGEDPKLELVECASLIAWPGARHQILHGDFLRGDHFGDDADEIDNQENDDDGIIYLDDDDDDEPDLPPRLVTFVYLQDCPTPDHGATAFLPGTATPEAHEQMHADAMSLVENWGPARLATVKAGDAVVYDASVLHFGSANTAPSNDRVVLYFSVAHPGAAAATVSAGLAAELPCGMKPVAPVPLSSMAHRGDASGSGGMTRRRPTCM